MKLSIIFFILFSLSLTGAEWNDPSLGTADPTKPVYQLDWGWFPPGNMWIGGAWSPKRIPTVEDLNEQLEYEGKLFEQRQLQKDLALCSKMILTGIAIFIAGMILHAINSLPILDRICEYGMALGIGTIVVAIIYRWFRTNETIILLFVVIPLLIAGIVAFILSRPAVKQWSITHGIRWAVGKIPSKKQVQGS